MLTWIVLNALKMKTLTHLILAGAVLLLCINCSGDDLNSEPEIAMDPPDCCGSSGIIYTDLEPDFSSDTQNPSFHSFELDLNNDQIVDYVLQYNSDGNEEWLHIASYPNQIRQNQIVCNQPFYSNPVPLHLDAEISSSPDQANPGLHYAAGGNFKIEDCLGGESGCFYAWKDQGDRFLGLQFEINGKVHYGWARIAITSPGEWVVKDYAYNAAPNDPINAGGY